MHTMLFIAGSVAAHSMLACTSAQHLFGPGPASMYACCLWYLLWCPVHGARCAAALTSCFLVRCAMSSNLACMLTLCAGGTWLTQSAPMPAGCSCHLHHQTAAVLPTILAQLAALLLSFPGLVGLGVVSSTTCAMCIWRADWLVVCIGQAEDAV